MATYMMTRIQVEDYDLWKQMFDSDPFDIRKAAKGHRLLRSVDDPNELSVSVEFASADEATAARERLLSSGVFDRLTLKSGPTVAEEAETLVY
jgi:hypothetical protein